MLIKFSAIIFIFQFLLRRQKIICVLFIGTEGGDLENKRFWRIIFAASGFCVEILKCCYRWKDFSSRRYARGVP